MDELDELDEELLDLPDELDDELELLDELLPSALHPAKSATPSASMVNFVADMNPPSDLIYGDYCTGIEKS